MKKLLSLLSVLTISGTAVPTTIVASSYQKQNKILKNIEIDSQQTNNLEILKRNKRENERKPINIDKLFLRNFYKIARRAIRNAALLISKFLRLRPRPRPVANKFKTLSKNDETRKWSVFEEFILNWDGSSNFLVSQSQLSPSSNNGEWRHEYVGRIASQRVRILSIAAVNSLPIKCSGNFNPNSNRQVKLDKYIIIVF